MLVITNIYATNQQKLRKLSTVRRCIVKVHVNVTDSGNTLCLAIALFDNCSILVFDAWCMIYGEVYSVLTLGPTFALE